jgi:ankyrin repeat protein
VPLAISLIFHHEVTDLILNTRNPDVNIVDKYGFSPIEHACFNGATKHIKKLIELGAELNNKRNPNQETALHVCFFNG